MARPPWSITADMFLSVSESVHLIRHVRETAAAATGRAGISRRLDQFIIETLLLSGLRNSEFCALRLGDAAVEGDEPRLLVRGGAGEERQVHVPASLADEVRRWVRDVRPLLLPRDVSPSDPEQPLVFNEHRRPYERTGLYRRVVRILTEAGLGERASVQLLRHTYGYLAYLRSGGNLLFVQRQLGHAHPMVTSIYAQFVEESYAAIANEVGGFLMAAEAEAAVPVPVAGEEVSAEPESDDVWLL